MDRDTFSRCHAVDGRRLEGAFTSYSDPNDPGLEALPVGQRPLIRFFADGRFVDEGLFAAFLSSGGGGDDRPGVGRYQLRDFTLFLEYEGGRVRREAFTFAGPPAPQPATVYVRRSALHRRTRS